MAAEPSDRRPEPVAIIRRAFPEISEVEVEALSRVAEARRYPAGTVLCHEGQVEHVFYIVADGQAAVMHDLGQGEKRVFAFRQPGEFFGEMALIDDKPRTADVTTVTESTMLEISEPAFKDFLGHSPSIALAVIRTITENMRASDRAAIAQLVSKNAELAKAYLDLKAAQAEIVKKERLERELEIAGEVQRSLLPSQFPQTPGYTYAGRNVPARHVGGDLYDVIQVDKDHVGLLMADVSDKSIHAALIMAVTRALFVAHAHSSLSPATVAQAVHNGLLEVSSTDDMFVTVFYGVVDLRSGRLCYVRAGQDKPLLFRAHGGPPLALEAEGRFLGMLPDLVLEEREVRLSPGDLLVAYSDGVTDAINEAEEAYGLERLIDLLAPRRGSSAEEVCADIFSEVFKFRGSAEAFDDITVLVMRCQAAP
jgi:sigma-B regulation protein RsbU (phosphoserine phosphatase)